MRDQLLGDINRNKYYGLLFDSTPDVGHREQMSQVIRLVDVDHLNKEVSVKETFLGYIQIHANGFSSHREMYRRIALDDCRSKCYDNAAVISGHISGVQKGILEINPRALFIRWDNHSLNLAGVHSPSQELLDLLWDN